MSPLSTLCLPPTHPRSPVRLQVFGSLLALAREGENRFDWNLTAGLKVGFIPNPRSGWKKRGAGIFAGQVLVALSWPLLFPHPLPFRCRERGVAAFAGEMADEEGVGRPSLAKSGGCEKLFLLKNPKFRKSPYPCS